MISILIPCLSLLLGALFFQSCPDKPLLTTLMIALGALFTVEIPYFRYVIGRALWPGSDAMLSSELSVEDRERLSRAGMLDPRINQSHRIKKKPKGTSVNHEQKNIRVRENVRGKRKRDENDQSDELRYHVDESTMIAEENKTRMDPSQSFQREASFENKIVLHPETQLFFDAKPDPRNANRVKPSIRRNKTKVKRSKRQGSTEIELESSDSWSRSSREEHSLLMAGDSTKIDKRRIERSNKRRKADDKIFDRKIRSRDQRPLTDARKSKEDLIVDGNGNAGQAFEVPKILQNKDEIPELKIHLDKSEKQEQKENQNKDNLSYIGI